MLKLYLSDCKFSSVKQLLLVLCDVFLAKETDTVYSTILTLFNSLIFVLLLTDFLFIKFVIFPNYPSCGVALGCGLLFAPV